MINWLFLFSILSKLKKLTLLMVNNSFCSQLGIIFILHYISLCIKVPSSGNRYSFSFYTKIVLKM